MKLKYDFEMMQLDDRIVAVPIGQGAIEYHNILKLNKSAAKILELLKEETTEEQIANNLHIVYPNIDKSQIILDVRNSIDAFSREGLIML